MSYVPHESALQAVEMVVPFSQHERHPSRLHRLDDIVANATVAQLVGSQLLAQSLEPVPCRTQDSETRRAEATGSGDPDASLPWGCRSDSPGRSPTFVAALRRSAVPCGDGMERPSTAPLPRPPVAADAPRGCDRVVRRLGRSLRPVRGGSSGHSRDTPTGLPTARGRYRGRRCCHVRVAPFATAVRSDCRIPLSASCPGSERDDHTNPARYRVALPWLRSQGTTQSASHDCWNGVLEEEPHVPALSGP